MWHGEFCQVNRYDDEPLLGGSKNYAARRRTSGLACEMDEFPGSLGMSASLALRLGQTIFSIASLLFMCLDVEFYSYTAFCLGRKRGGCRRRQGEGARVLGLQIWPERELRVRC